MEGLRSQHFKKYDDFMFTDYVNIKPIMYEVSTFIGAGVQIRTEQ